MPEFKPFYGWRYHPDRVDISRVVAPPYDVVNEDETRRYLRQDPHNIFHLELGEELPGDHENENRYLRAKRHLEDWIKEGVLVREDRPAFYLYRLRFTYQGQTFTRTGFIGLVRLSPFSEGRILPHEKTFSKVTEDRLQLLRATGAQFSQVFALYRDPEKKTLKLSLPEEPLYQVEESSGIAHEFYVIEDPEVQETLSLQLSEKVLYIADGHHRYNTALKYAEEMEAKFKPDGPRCFHYLMMYLCPFEDPGLLVLPTHRLLKIDIPEETVKNKLKDLAEVKKENPSVLENSGRPSKGELLWLAPEGVLSIRIRPEILSAWEKETGLPESELPASWCARLIEILCGKPEKTLKEKGLLRYTPWLSEIKKDLSAGNRALILPETPLSVLEKVATSGKVMPHKSTYFYPKILTGFVIFRINPEAAPPCP